MNLNLDHGKYFENEKLFTLKFKCWKMEREKLSLLAGYITKPFCLVAVFQSVQLKMANSFLFLKKTTFNVFNKFQNNTKTSKKSHYKLSFGVKIFPISTK